MITNNIFYLLISGTIIISWGLSYKREKEKKKEKKKKLDKIQSKLIK